MSTNKSLFLVASLLVAALAVCLASDTAAASDAPLRGGNRVLAQYYPGRPFLQQSCARFPRMCTAFGSPGPDCCRGQCVDAKTDMFNCGQCGRWCRFGEACCGGQCVSLMFDANNCGVCGNKCERKGDRCTYGMCSYA